MSTVLAVILTRFRKTAEQAAAWLITERYQSLFIDLPEELTPFVKAFMDGALPQEEVWRSYGFLTGLSDPLITALRYQASPILTLLPKLRNRIPRVGVYCYQDVEAHLEAGRLSERLLLLEVGERIRRRIKVEAWRTLLRDELAFSTIGLERIVENISEEARKYSRNAVLYRGSVMPLKGCLEERGFKVEPIYFQRYWRSPLDVLRTLVWLRGIDNVSDKLVRKCVDDHLGYLDYVLSSENIDAAHDQWTFETRPDVPNSVSMNRVQADIN